MDPEARGDHDTRHRDFTVMEFSTNMFSRILKVSRKQIADFLQSLPVVCVPLAWRSKLIMAHTT